MNCYYCAFFVDGDKIRNSFCLNQQIKAKWYKNGHRSVMPKPYYFLDIQTLKGTGGGSLLLGRYIYSLTLTKNEILTLAQVEL